MNRENQELEVYKACADSCDSSCLLAYFETLNQLLNFSGPQHIGTELEALGEKGC